MGQIAAPPRSIMQPMQRRAVSSGGILFRFLFRNPDAEDSNVILMRKFACKCARSQRVGGFLRIGGAGRDARDFLVAERAIEAVTAKNDGIASSYGNAFARRINLGDAAGADITRKRIAIGIDRRILRRHDAALNQLGELRAQRMRMIKLGQGTVTAEIKRTVAY